MKGKAQHYNGIYHDMFIILGEEVTKKIYQFYRGQQVTFPMRSYSNQYTIEYLTHHYNGQNLKQLSRELGYTERWIKQLIDRYQVVEIKSKS